MRKRRQVPGRLPIGIDTPLLWLAGAAALAVAGGRFSRRAALRGAVAMGVVSAGSGLVARIGHRPLPARTAGAVAFVTGAGLELPLLAVPLGAAALVPIALAVRQGRHQLAPAAMAAAAGVSVALASRRVWPLAPREAAELTPSMTQVSQTPSPQGRGLSIVVNETAGPALSGHHADELRTELPEAEIIEVGEETDLATALEQAASSALAIGVAGGDGTINAGAAVAADHDKPLMAIPAGTLNHLARDLGLISLEGAVEAVRLGQTVAVDLGTIDGQIFLNTASFGSYVDLVDARERLESTIGKWPAVVVALGRVLRHAEPVDVELDGRRRSVWMAFIGNCRYQPSGFSPSWRPRLDDGQLDIRIVDGARPWSRARLGLALLTGTLGRCGVYEQWAAPELRVRSLEGPLRLARDGETFDGAPEFTVGKKGQLAVYVPYG